MGGVVSAIGDVVGGVADAVGSVAEAAIDVASTVVEAVAENPILAVAAIAAAPALAGMAGAAAGGAVAGAGIDAAAMGIIGPTLMGAAGATEAALSAAALSAGAGAGILGGGATMGGLTLLPAAAGSTEALAGATGAAQAAGAAEAAGAATSPTSWGTGFTGTTGEIGPSSLISNVPDAATAVSNATNSIAASNTSLAVDSAVQNTTYQIGSSGGSFMDQIQAAQMMNQGVPYQQVISSVSNGSIIPNPISEAYNSVTTGFKNISDAANGFINNIGQQLLPGADPMLQKAASNFVMNTAMTGDPEAALKNTAIGMGGQWVGQQAFNATGSSLAANAAKSGASTLLAGGDPINALINTGISAGGQEIGNLTNSPIIGKGAATLAGTALGGGDIGNAAINFGASQFNPLVGQVVKTALGPDIPTPVSNIAQRVAQNTAQNIATGAPKTVNTSSLIGPLAQTATNAVTGGTGTQAVNAPLQIASNALTSTIKRNAPAQVVQLSNLIPIAYDSSLSKLLKQTG
jgi:hypothetical protein